jgi:uncharacterized protein
MQCPACPDTTLAMTTREGIEIDYCPKCRGVWLDRGELDKIIERSLGTPAGAAPAGAVRPPPPPHQGGYQGGYRPDYDDDDYKKHHYGKRRRGFLGDLFDFD